MITKRQVQKEQTRKKIIETAYGIYASQGFRASTAAIAKAAGVSHGTIFLHFPTVEALVCAVIQDFADILGTHTHCFAEDGGSMEALLKGHLDVLAMHESFYIRLITEKNLLPGSARDIAEDLQSFFAHHFYTVAEREKARIKGIPASILLNTWMGLVHYYLQNKALFSPDTPLINRYAEELVAAFIILIEK